MAINISRHLGLNKDIYQFAVGYLDKLGWFESLQGIPRDKHGFLPWITYPAIRQLQRLVKPNFRVFEYGCGGSSLWWASRVSKVVSVEHNPEWANNVKKSAPPNLTVIVREIDSPCPTDRMEIVSDFFNDLPELPVSNNHDHNIAHGLLCEEFKAYATEITTFEKHSFDVIVIDGMARTLTAWLAINYLKPSGFIVFDNSDRWQYNSAYRILSKAGFRRIDYYGPGPANRFEWCTSIFARDLGVFNESIDSPKGDNDIGW